MLRRAAGGAEQPRGIPVVGCAGADLRQRFEDLRHAELVAALEARGERVVQKILGDRPLPRAAARRPRTSLTRAMIDGEPTCSATARASPAARSAAATSPLTRSVSASCAWARASE